MNFLSTTKTMTIDAREAEFLAMLFDASLAVMENNKKNIGDWIVSQEFLGYTPNPDNLSNEDLANEMEISFHEMLCLRSRIRERFSI